MNTGGLRLLLVRTEQRSLGVSCCAFYVGEQRRARTAPTPRPPVGCLPCIHKLFELLRRLIYPTPALPLERGGS
jgi:hypothetical protein